MSDRAIARQRARKWEQKWASVANERLMNAARGESSPWLAIKQALYNVPLSSLESQGSEDGTYYTGTPIDTRARESAYAEAMKSAERQAAARAAARAAMERGGESPESLAKGQQFLQSEPQMPSAWLEMYPQFQKTRPGMAGNR